MMDPIGWKATRPAARVTTPAPAAPVRAAPPRTETVATTALARELAASPPVDGERVARIRKAIADGRFPLLPSTVADRLIALKLEWDPNEAVRDQA